MTPRLHQWLALASFAALAIGGSVQVPNLQVPTEYSAHKETVKGLFKNSYEAYQKYAWGHDDLLPVSKSYVDNRNGWGATIVDALDTMWIMNFPHWFEAQVEHIARVDFALSQTNDSVSVFETTIRYIGGLLTAYELSGKKNYTLVQKAEQIAQKLAYAFNGDSPIPYNSINFTDRTPIHGSSNIAQAGTLTMEWDRLSLYTGNDTYRQLAEKSVQHMIQMQKVLPGMPALSIDPSNGGPVGSHVTWGGGCDSFYEYLIKYPRLTNTNDNSYADAWLTAVDTSVKVLLKHSTVGEWTYLADFNNEILHVGSHLACFYGGNWILGGKLTNNDTIFNIGLRLTDACWNTYASTATGIGPEEFAYTSRDGNSTGRNPPTSQEREFYDKHGFYITTSNYGLRPEVLESNFYAWRATGNTKYLDHAVSAIKSFQEHLPATVAYAGLNDVNNVSSSKIDLTPSFWYAEVLKYLYLTFDNPETISLNEYVFNTEAHPFKAPTAKGVYGSKR